MKLDLTEKVVLPNGKLLSDGKGHDESYGRVLATQLENGGLNAEGKPIPMKDALKLVGLAETIRKEKPFEITEADLQTLKDFTDKAGLVNFIKANLYRKFIKAEK